MVESELWAQIDENWSQIFRALKVNLPTHEYQMFTTSGEIVESGRPMIESIVSDKFSRSEALFFYLAAGGLVSVPEASHRVTGTTNEGGKIIEITAISGLNLSFSGSESNTGSKVHRQS